MAMNCPKCGKLAYAFVGAICEDCDNDGFDDDERRDD